MAKQASRLCTELTRGVYRDIVVGVYRTEQGRVELTRGVYRDIVVGVLTPVSCV